jgi:hypothetical protein
MATVTETPEGFAHPPSIATLGAFATAALARLPDPATQRWALESVQALVPTDSVDLAERQRVAGVLAATCMPWLLAVLREHHEDDHVVEPSLFLLRRVAWVCDEGQLGDLLPAAPFISSVIVRCRTREAVGIVQHALRCLQNLSFWEPNQVPGDLLAQWTPHSFI